MDPNQQNPNGLNPVPPASNPIAQPQEVSASSTTPVAPEPAAPAVAAPVPQTQQVAAQSFSPPAAVVAEPTAPVQATPEPQPPAPVAVPATSVPSVPAPDQTVAANSAEDFTPPPPPPASEPTVIQPLAPAQPTVPAQPTMNKPQFTPGVHDEMRSKIMKIIIGLIVVSIVGVGLLFLLVNTSDSSLESLREAENSKASYSVPSEWTEEATIDGTDYFNGDTEESSSAVVSVLDPQRLKFNGKPLSKNEVSLIVDRLSDLDNKDLGGGITVIEQNKVDIGGFNDSYEFYYESVALDGQTKILGKIRVMFDSKANMHGIEIAAVKTYWNNNQEKFEAILDTYRLK